MEKAVEGGRQPAGPEWDKRVARAQRREGDLGNALMIERVKCGTKTHRVGYWRRGPITLFDHPRSQIPALRELRTLGDKTCGCLECVDWIREAGSGASPSVPKRRPATIAMVNSAIGLHMRRATANRILTNGIKPGATVTGVGIKPGTKVIGAHHHAAREATMAQFAAALKELITFHIQKDVVIELSVGLAFTDIPAAPSRLKPYASGEIHFTFGLDGAFLKANFRGSAATRLLWPSWSARGLGRITPHGVVVDVHDVSDNRARVLLAEVDRAPLGRLLLVAREATLARDADGVWQRIAAENE